MSDTYKDVLVAIDGSEESRHILSRAVSIACSGGGRLHLLHVIEPLALAYGVGPLFAVAGSLGSQLILSGQLGELRLSGLGLVICKYAKWWPLCFQHKNRGCE